jgi:hypothetical protein
MISPVSTASPISAVWVQFLPETDTKDTKPNPGSGILGSGGRALAQRRQGTKFRSLTMSELNRLRVAVELAQSSQYRSRVLRSEQAVDEVQNEGKG